jgi:hypothetical protein
MFNDVELVVWEISIAAEKGIPDAAVSNSATLAHPDREQG